MKLIFSTIVLLVFHLNSFAQAPPKCYSKIMVIDSASGKETSPVFDINGALPTLYIKDGSGCNCVISQFEFILVRERRPLFIQKYLSGGMLRLSNIKAIRAQQGTTLQDGDYFIIEIKDATLGNQKCQLSSKNTVFSGKFIQSK